MRGRRLTVGLAARGASADLRGPHRLAARSSTMLSPPAHRPALEPDTSR